VLAIDEPPAGPELPNAPSFGRPFPNPAPGAVRFVVALPSPSRVTLQVLDVQGRVVATMRDHLEAGYRVMDWDGRNASGQKVPAGIFFVRLLAEGRLVGQHRIVLR
jgi:hypothetical protein